MNRAHATLIVGNATTLDAADLAMEESLKTLGFDTYYLDDDSPAEFLPR